MTSGPWSQCQLWKVMTDWTANGRWLLMVECGAGHGDEMKEARNSSQRKRKETKEIRADKWGKNWDDHRCCSPACSLGLLTFFMLVPTKLFASSLNCGNLRKKHINIILINMKCGPYCGSSGRALHCFTGDSGSIPAQGRFLILRQLSLPHASCHHLTLSYQ